MSEPTVPADIAADVVNRMQATIDALTAERDEYLATIARMTSHTPPIAAALRQAERERETFHGMFDVAQAEVVKWSTRALAAESTLTRYREALDRPGALTAAQLEAQFSGASAK